MVKAPLKHRILLALSSGYRRRFNEAVERDHARFCAFWEAAADVQLSRSEVGREALRRKTEGPA